MIIRLFIPGLRICLVYMGMLYRFIGAVNVQVIMEKLGGGGHQTMAGAQLKDVSVGEVRERLIGILNETEIHKENL